uniref:hypothetical protein n=1 Tax=Trichocoleus desertorum TaxID=1481672 RepID=UPI0025B390A0|nr:hypothetical protein [Trichocoleus desertorum]
MTARQQTKTNAITYQTAGEVVQPEVQTIVNVCRPLQAEGYAQVPVQGDRWPLFIGAALVLAFVTMFGIHVSDTQRQQLQAQNARLAAESDAIAGCIEGVRRGR